MKSPFSLPRYCTASVVFDPCVPVAMPAPRPSDEEYEARWRAGVKAIETRNLRERCDSIVFLRRQA